MKVKPGFTFINGIHKGKESANPEGMKRKQVIVNLAGLLASIVCLGIKNRFPDLAVFDYQDDLTTLFVMLMGIANYYLTIVSTKKIGPLG